MGVTGLLALLKDFASCKVDLNDGMGTIVVDGHASMHRAAAKGHVAKALALDNEVTDLVLGMAHELRLFEEAGWNITVVFDGATPPSKAGTSDDRSLRRSTALEQCLKLQAQNAVDETQVERYAKQAVAFTPQIVARVSKMLKHVLRGDCFTAPFEADPQLVVMEEFYSRSREGRCFVRGNDSDLVVLGVRSLLWDVSVGRDGLHGQCITQTNIVRPQMQVLSGSSQGHGFLRLLHGVAADGSADAIFWAPNATAVKERLRYFSCVAGNDYAKFAGIGPARAMEIVLCHGAKPSIADIKTALVDATGASCADVSAALKTAMDMYCHPVAWFPRTGEQKHLSGITSAPDIVANTGSPAPADVALNIAAQRICPSTRRPWGEAAAVSLVGLPDPVVAQRRFGSVGGDRKRGDLLRPDDVNNYERSGFSRLPDTRTDFSVWSVEKLREFLMPFRCMEHAGTSSLRKADLVTLASRCIEVVVAAGLAGSNLAFRPPVVPAAPPEPHTLPPPEAVWLAWENLRESLPEFEEGMIVAWLRQRGGLSGGTGRVLYRGLQRVMDLGALGGLFGVPCDDMGGVLWLKFTASGSMRDVEYQVTAAIEVEKVEVVDGSDGLEQDNEGGRHRLVAVNVIRATCDCTAGASSGCHHVCQLLQLTRLLQLTETALSAWNPNAPTSIACQWILRHCGGRRDAEFNIWHCKPVNEIITGLRVLRDPKKHPFTGGADEPIHTRGVVAMDRVNDYSAYPDHGEWSRERQLYDEGKTFSQSKWSVLDLCMHAEREARGYIESQDPAIFNLPPKFRPESP